jgi:hypothetical protein
MIVEYIRYEIESEQHKEFEDAYEKAGNLLGLRLTAYSMNSRIV